MHHVVYLSDGGLNVIENALALCPNCHSKCHHAINTETVQQDLKRKIERIVSEDSLSEVALNRANLYRYQ